MLSILATILFIFGPSCGGKSTLSQALIEKLGPSWTYLDRDRLIEENACLEENGNKYLDEQMRSHQGNFVVDTQLPWRAPLNGEKYIAVTAPLKVLLARDEKRNIVRMRSPKRAFYARLFVEETHQKILSLPEELDFSYDLILDTSEMSTRQEIEAVFDLINL